MNNPKLSSSSHGNTPIISKTKQQIKTRESFSQYQDFQFVAQETQTPSRVHHHEHQWKIKNSISREGSRTTIFEPMMKIQHQNVTETKSKWTSFRNWIPCSISRARIGKDGRKKSLPDGSDAVAPGDSLFRSSFLLLLLFSFLCLYCGVLHFFILFFFCLVGCSQLQSEVENG